MAKRAAVTTIPMISLMRRKTCTTCRGVRPICGASVVVCVYYALEQSAGV